MEENVKDSIQAFRDLVRPTITLMFCFTFCVMVSYAGSVDMVNDKVKYAIEELKPYVGLIMGYHFGKSTTKDSKQ